MTQEDYVTYEVAKMLKGKGYDEECDAYYHNDNSNAYWGANDDERFESCDGGFYNGNNFYRDAAPTLYEAQKWLREKHTIHVDATPVLRSPFDEIPYVYWSYIICNTDTCMSHAMDDYTEFKTYEEALNAGIKKALEFI